MKILRQLTYPKKKKAKQNKLTPMTCLHYLKIGQKTTIMEKWLVRKNLSKTVMVVITLRQKFYVAGIR